MRGLIIVGFLALLTPAVVAAPATREDIRQLRGEVKEDISKLRGEIKDDIKQVIHYVDKRFDDASKRFDMLMWFIGILSVVSTGVISYMISRIGKQDAKINTVESRFATTSKR